MRDAGGQTHLQVVGKGPLLLKGAQQCLLHADQLRGRVHHAGQRTAQCHSGQGAGLATPEKGQQLRDPLCCSHHLHLWGARPQPRLFILGPLVPTASSRPSPGSARSVPEPRGGAADAWSGLRGFLGAPGRSPQPHSCYSSCRVYKATIWWLMEATKGARLAIASAASFMRTAGRWSSERRRRGRLGSPRSHFLTLGSSAS